MKYSEDTGQHSIPKCKGGCSLVLVYVGHVTVQSGVHCTLCENHKRQSQEQLDCDVVHFAQSALKRQGNADPNAVWLGAILAVLI